MLLERSSLNGHLIIIKIVTGWSALLCIFWKISADSVEIII